MGHTNNMHDTQTKHASHMSLGHAPFFGVATALITPFTADGSQIDHTALQKLIDRQCDAGIDALLIAGTTGEADTLCDAEYTDLLNCAVRYTAHRVPIIAGCGSNDTAHACRRAQIAANAGCDALLAVTPYYNKASRHGLLLHFREIADATPLPLLLYNVPARTGCDLDVETACALSAHPRIVGIKEASGSIDRISDLLASCNHDFTVYSGNDSLFLPSLSIGSGGVLSVLSNLIPSEMHTLAMLYASGNTKEAANRHRKWTPLCHALNAEVNPIPIKEALSLLGLCEPSLRLPLCRAEESTRALLKSALTDIGLL